MQARQWMVLLLLGVRLESSGALAADRPEPRFDRATTERNRAVRPPAAQPPSALSARGARPGAPRRPPLPHPENADVEQRGNAEGARAFEELARADGWRTLYRAGIFEGQHASLGDPALGRGDYEQGLRLGRVDPEGREYGSREGAVAGEHAATRDAPEQVERQFMDLTWQPIASPRAPDARFEGAFPPTAEPDLESLFRDYPITRVASLPRRMGEAFSGTRWTPWGVQGCSSWEQVVEWSWQDANAVFTAWASDLRRSAPWRALSSPAQRELFQAAFADGFDDRLSAVYPALVDDAWGNGYADGWLYGAFLRSEWSFRQGYAAGFDAGIALAADIAFERSYGVAYERAYQASYRDWMEHAHTSLLSARLLDGDDDGIFRPGEAVEAEFTLANYGGADASIEVWLEGAPLRSSASTTLRVPARRKLDAPRPLSATVSPDTSTPSQQTLVLSLPGGKLDLPLKVSYPMEFTGSVSYESHALEGRGAIRFEIVNRSRRPQEQVALLRDTGGSDPRVERREIGRVDPGAVAEAQFDLEGVRPLDLLGGTLIVRASVAAGGEVHDRKVARFPELATRLDHPDLVAYLIRLGRAQDAPVDDIAGARGLLMQRLQADWNVRIEEKGNAYESDLRDGGSRTAVGELVRAYRAEGPKVGDSLAFHGLDEEVGALADRLEGVHPNLRRSMRKLARRLAP